MAVTIVLGMTQSGKSWLVEKKIIPEHSRVIVFDVMNCFTSMQERFSMDANFGLENKALEKAFMVAHNRPAYFKIALVPSKNSDDKKIFDKIISTAFILGEKIASADNKILLVADEAGGICSNKFQSSRLQKLVTKGRHYNVDSLFIAQRPQMLHGDIKGNASTVHCFKITTAPEINFLIQLFGRELCQKIRDLPKFHFLTWNETGKTYFTDEKGVIYGEKA